jgi:hypothetical protein
MSEANRPAESEDPYPRRDVRRSRNLQILERVAACATVVMILAANRLRRYYRVLAASGLKLQIWKLPDYKFHGL